MGKWSDIDFKGKENYDGDIKVRCPSCDDRRSDKHDKSLSINPSKGLGMCHYCGDTFAAKDNNRDDEEVVAYELPKQDWQNYTELSDSLVKWFSETRGISQLTLNDFKLGEKKVYFGNKAKELNAIVFNYFQDGVLVHEHYRSGHKDFSQSKNTKPILYNIDSMRGNDYVIITEGQIDCMSFHEVGLESVVSVPSGAGSFGHIEKVKALFDDKTKIYLGTDKDAPGLELENKIIELFGKSKCYLMTYPMDCKDPNDVLLKYGRDALVQAYEDAVPVALTGDVIEDPEAMNYYLEQYYAGDIPRGRPLMLGTKFDNELVFRDKAFHMVVAKTNIGKSIITYWMLFRLAKYHGVKSVLLSMENSNSMIRNTLVSYYLEDNPDFVYKNNPKLWWEAVNFVDKYFTFINNTKGMGLEESLEVAAAVNEMNGANLLLLDPINSIPMVKPYDNMSDYSYHVWSASRLLTFSKKTMGVVMNAHAITGVGRNKDNPPKLYDVEMGGIYVNKIDMGFVFDRSVGSPDEFERNTTRIWTTKVRDSRLFGGEITPDDDPMELRFTGYNFKALTRGLYGVEEVENYV